MKDAIRTEVKGIKCDNPECDFRDDSVRFEDYESWLNKPCPKCGANLLTEADVKLVKGILALTRTLAKIFDPVKDSTPEVTARMHMDGSGLPRSFEIVDEE